jgi:hypothetical protein
MFVHHEGEGAVVNKVCNLLQYLWILQDHEEGKFFLLVYVFFIVNLFLSMFFIAYLLNWTWVYILFKTWNNLGFCVFFVFAFLLMF